MNSLQGDAMNWIGDGKEGASFEIHGNELTLIGGKQGTPFNVRMDLQTPLADYYFHVIIQEMTKSLSIGVVTPAEFKTGWKTQGMFYNGNLTNGSGAKAVSWGPRFEAGDSLGVRVISTAGFLEVVFYKNGKSLGTGFLIENVDNKNYCPCIHLDGQAKLTIEIPEALPPKEISTEVPTDMYGPWKLVEAVTRDGTPLNMPGRPVTLDLSREQHDALKMHIKAGNPINCSAKIVGDNGNSLTIKMGRMMSGRMMPPPGLREIETLLCGLGANTLTLENDDRLTLSNEPTRTVWVRNPRDPQTLTSYR